MRARSSAKSGSYIEAEGLLDFDSGHRGAWVDCGGGRLADFSDYRYPVTATCVPLSELTTRQVCQLHTDPDPLGK